MKILYIYKIKAPCTRVINNELTETNLQNHTIEKCVKSLIIIDIHKNYENFVYIQKSKEKKSLGYQNP
jgi:hypothetical protein